MFDMAPWVIKIKQDVITILNVAYLLCWNNIIFNLIPEHMQSRFPSGGMDRQRLWHLIGYTEFVHHFMNY